MEPADYSIPTAPEMIDAFVHAPTILILGERIDGDPTVVLSHVELWSWRVVVRGVVAHPRFSPGPAPPPIGETEGSFMFGAVTAEVVEPTRSRRAAWRRNIAWMNSWTLADDVGTDYRLSGWHGPDNDELWRDVEWSYDTAAAPTARQLTLTGPGLDPIEIARPSR